MYNVSLNGPQRKMKAYLDDGRALNKRVYQRVVQNERDDVEDQVRRVQQLALDNHGHDTCVLAHVLAAKHALELVAVVDQAADDEHRRDDVECERETPEAECKVHGAEDGGGSKHNKEERAENY